MKLPEHDLGEFETIFWSTLQRRSTASVAPYLEFCVGMRWGVWAQT